MLGSGRALPVPSLLRVSLGPCVLTVPTHTAGHSETPPLGNGRNQVVCPVAKGGEFYFPQHPLFQELRVPPPGKGAREAGSRPHSLAGSCLAFVSGI